MLAVQWFCRSRHVTPVVALFVTEGMMYVSSVGLFLGRVVGFLVGRRLYGLMTGCRLVIAD